MTRSVSYRLPWPPSLNRIWRAVAGRIVLSKVARDWKVAAANALPTGHVEPLRGRLAVWLQLSPPVGARKLDVANREKLLCDTLTEQRVWLDDEQIDMLVIVRGKQCDKGYVDISITEL